MYWKPGDYFSYENKSGYLNIIPSLSVVDALFVRMS